MAYVRTPQAIQRKQLTQARKHEFDVVVANTKNALKYHSIFAPFASYEYTLGFYDLHQDEIRDPAQQEQALRRGAFILASYGVSKIEENGELNSIAASGQSLTDVLVKLPLGITMEQRKLLQSLGLKCKKTKTELEYRGKTDMVRAGPIFEEMNALVIMIPSFASTSVEQPDAKIVVALMQDSQEAIEAVLGEQDTMVENDDASTVQTVALTPTVEETAEVVADVQEVTVDNAVSSPAQADYEASERDTEVKANNEDSLKTEAADKAGAHTDIRNEWVETKKRVKPSKPESVLMDLFKKAEQTDMTTKQEPDFLHQRERSELPDSMRPD